MSNTRNQITLAKMLAWTALFAIVFASLSTYPDIVEGMRFHQYPDVSRVGIVLISWMVLLVIYIRIRHITAILVHAIPLMIVPVLYDGVRLDDPYFLQLVLGQCVLSTGISFVLLLQSTASAIIDREAQPGKYLIFRTVGGLFGFAFLCSLMPSLLRGQISVPAIVFGAIIGFWSGLYHAFATSKRVGKAKIGNVRLKSVVTAGFLGAVIGPAFYELSSRYLLGFYFLPSRYSPAIGFLTAFLTACVLHFSTLTDESRA